MVQLKLGVNNMLIKNKLNSKKYQSNCPYGNKDISKEKLLEKFIEVNTSIEASPENNCPNNNQFIGNKSHKKIKSLENQANNLKSILLEKDKEINKNKGLNKSLRNDINELSHQIILQNNKIENLTMGIKQKELQLQLDKDLINENLKMIFMVFIHNLTKMKTLNEAYEKLEQRHDKVKNHLNTITQTDLNLENKSLKRRLKYAYSELDICENEIENLKIINEHTVIEIKEELDQQYKIEYEILKNISLQNEPKKSVKSYFDSLHNSMNIDNIDEYKQSYYLFRKYLSYRNEIINKTDVNEEYIINKIYETGWINKENENWIFTTIDKLSYPVLTMPTVNENGMPAKASIELGFARIKEVYPIKDETNSKIENNYFRDNYKIINKDKNEEEYIQFGYFTVLIIGSRNKKSYIEILMKHGLYVIWFDSFEKNADILRAEIGKADIIIACRSHMRHYVLDILNEKDEEDERVEYIERDSINSIVARVRYSAIKQGLIKLI
jgi:hypothetical protein